MTNSAYAALTLFFLAFFVADTVRFGAFSWCCSGERISSWGGPFHPVEPFVVATWSVTS